ncbi:iron complex outermembrane recepter protein [Rhodoblastus acidophilus]|uniref:Iron complex outermembrane recepter protein n=1 Tax=Rhodoblastus acidophilus TaxID=1074 RepID=A0A212PZC6_RHOAC|nr:TonB-dependent receptor [Rhodoblastus acidophilus]SNB52370.1 iron complex outermembrane recepter protein [Rhodoblastus acidophilus]
MSLFVRRRILLSSVAPIALIGGAVTLACLGAGAANAQSAPTDAAAPAPAAAPASGQVEEVTITARDRAEKAQDVPLPISAIGKATAEREHFEGWKDVVQKVPSFTPAVANPRTGANGLRGITGIAGGTDGSEGGVGVIVDNVFYTHIGFSWLTTYDIDSIQVARGPQGTLLGKNTTIGAIIINTKEPSFEPQTTTETTVGSRRLVEEKFSNTGTLIPDTLAYRISGFGTKQDGFIKNLYAPAGDPDGQNVNRWGGRGQLLGTFGDITDRVIVEHDASHENNNGTGTFDDGWNRNFDGSARKIAVVTGAGAAVYNTPQGALSALFPQYASRIAANPWAAAYTDIGSLKTRTDGVSNELNWHIGDYTLTSVSAWRRFDFQPHNWTGNFGIKQYSDLSVGYDVNVNQYSQELRIASPTGEQFEWTGGLYFLRELVNSRNITGLGPDAVTMTTANNTNVGIYNSSILDGVSAFRFGRTGVTTFAQFAQGTYHYDDKAALTLGIRNSWEDRTASDTGYYYGGAALPANLQNVRTDYVIANTGGTNFNINGEQKTDSISFLINPSYKVTENFNAYFNFARGVKSGAANTDAVPVYTGNTPAAWAANQLPTVIGYQDAITKPEVAYDFELGFKSSWLDNRLQVNANVYDNEIYDFQAKLVNYFSYNTNGQTVYVPNNYLGNVPRVRLAGFETDGRYSPIDDLWITWSGAYNGAWYVKFPNSALPADYQASAVHPTTIDLSGGRVPNVTPFTFSLGATYEYAAGAFIGENWRGYVYGNQFFKSTTQFSLGAGSTAYVLKQPSYSTFNAGFGFKTSNENIDVGIWAKNLFNRRAAQSMALSTNLALGTLYWNDPLTVGVTLRTKF